MDHVRADYVFLNALPICGVFLLSLKEGTFTQLRGKVGVMDERS